MKSPSSPSIISDWEVTDSLVHTQAVRTSMYGRPGACYIDIAGDMVNAKVDRSQIRFAPVYRVKYLYIFFLKASLVFDLFL